MFKWFEKILIKIAKKILNKYAPKGEFLAYINKREEKLLKQYGGAGLPIKKTGIKSFFSFFAISILELYLMASMNHGSQNSDLHFTSIMYLSHSKSNGLNWSSGSIRVPSWG